MLSIAMRLRRLLVALALSVALAALPAVLPTAPEPSPHGTTVSLRGEVRVALRGLCLAADAARDPALDRAFAPLRALLVQSGGPAAAHARPAPPAPPASAAELEAAEKRLADLIARIAHPLPAALLAQIADPRADVGVRALLMRVMAHRWPAETADALLPVLAKEPRLTAFAEAATVAGKLAGADDRLAPALRAAAGRTRGWGRQYPIAALVAAGEGADPEAIAPALEDADPAVRRHAALYMAAFGHMRWLAKVDRMSRRDADPTTRFVAQEAAARMVGVRLASKDEATRREELDRALLPRLAMHRGTVH
jgi:hypothetical protein